MLVWYPGTGQSAQQVMLEKWHHICLLLRRLAVILLKYYGKIHLPFKREKGRSWIIMQLLVQLQFPEKHWNLWSNL